MRLFGSNLFNHKKTPQTMYDFAKHGILNINSGDRLDSLLQEVGQHVNSDSKPEKKEKKKKEKEYTPKELYYLKMLHDGSFSIKVEEQYISESISLIEDKLSLIPRSNKKTRTPDEDGFVELGGVRYGRLELESIKERLKNRRKINDFSVMNARYPHTTNELIRKVMSENNHLRCGKADEFVPDFPQDAIDAMKEYNNQCVRYYEKKTNFYVMAKKEDFEVKNRRRDPILFAQSPFGFFWQILGAWDEEMILLDEL